MNDWFESGKDWDSTLTLRSTINTFLPVKKKKKRKQIFTPMTPVCTFSSSAGKKLMVEAATLDDHLLHEILSRLPAKALGRFMLTSKKWKTLISDPYLKTIQAQRSTQNVLGILSATAYSLGRRLTYFPLEHNAGEVPDTSLGLPGPQAETISLKCACNGLLLIQVFPPIRDLLCNPTTKYSRQIPDLEICYNDTKFGLAFDPTVSTANFKVVATERVCQEAHGGCYKFYVYSSEANTWRLSNATISCTRKHLLRSASSVFFNGALHWLREREDILAFNVEQEVAYSLALPDELRPISIACYISIWLGVVDGHMSVVKFKRGDILVWVLEDYESRRWELKHCIETQGSGYYLNSVPIFYDGEKCVLVTWGSSKEEYGLAVYRINGGQWDEIRSLTCSGFDRCFVPYISHMLG
ncbi:F-box protein At5g49610-like [Elaeis guineensis]|uniref:F-box protein At5g49610-like n=1 Tax=Elaeis guineensis var. tenera TaxID=51953 RepID=UPI003C6D79F5